jgi:hypothetical protein
VTLICTPPSFCLVAAAPAYPAKGGPEARGGSWLGSPEHNY